MPIVAHDPNDPAAIQIREARKVLQNYLTAKTWQELIPLSIPVENLRERMEAHYQKYPYEPIAVPLFSFTSNMENGRLLFRVEQPRELSVALHPSDGGYQINWVAFAEFRNSLLDEFLMDHGKTHTGSQTLTALVRRAHYFGQDIPESIRSKSSYTLQAPFGTEKEFAFAENEKLDSKLPGWSGSEVDILSVTLRWLTTATNTPYLIIESVEQAEC